MATEGWQPENGATRYVGTGSDVDRDHGFIDDATGAEPGSRRSVSPCGHTDPAVPRGTAMTVEHRDIPATNLMLDAENPRLAEGEKGQPNTIVAVLRASGPKTIALAKDISERGLSPAERLIVMPHPATAGRFVVLEGNRRVTALKILAEPSLAEDAIEDTDLNKVMAWGKKFVASGNAEKIPCAVFQNREEADPWVELRHQGEQGGVGVVPWGALENARYAGRRTGKYAPELQVLDFVEKRGELDAETKERLRDVPITNLRRLINDEAARTALGIEIGDDRMVTTLLPEAEVLKGLTRVIRDLAGGMKVKAIYTRENRKDYLDSFKANELPNKAKNGTQARPLLEAGRGSTPAPAAPPRKRSASTKARIRLVPSGCPIKTPHSRVNAILEELKSLPLEPYANSVAVLLRVFLELSVDEVCKELMLAKEFENAKLLHKVQTTLKHLLKEGDLTEDEASAARAATNPQNFLCTSITTMHGYVHNRHMTPSPSDLRAAWDKLQPMFEGIWEE